MQLHNYGSGRGGAAGLPASLSGKHLTKAELVASSPPLNAFPEPVFFGRRHTAQSGANAAAANFEISGRNSTSSSMNSSPQSSRIIIRCFRSSNKTEMMMITMMDATKTGRRLTRRRPPSIDPSADPPQIKSRFGYKAALSAHISCTRSEDGPGLRTPLPISFLRPPGQTSTSASPSPPSATESAVALLSLSPPMLFGARPPPTTPQLSGRRS